MNINGSQLFCNMRLFRCNQAPDAAVWSAPPRGYIGGFMARNISLFLLLGVLWVFLLSIPVGQGRTVYDLAHYFLVDTAPVNWISGQFSKTVAKTQTTSETAGESAKAALQNGRERFSDYTSSYQAAD